MAPTTTMTPEEICAACGGKRVSFVVPMPEALGGPRTLWDCPTCTAARTGAARRNNPAEIRRIVNALSRVPEEFAAARVKDHPNADAREIGRNYVFAVPKPPMDELLQRRDWSDTPDNRLELQSEGRYAMKGAPGLGIVGLIGRGKTGLAAAILNALRGFGIAGVMVNVEALMREIQSTYDRGGPRLATVIEPLLRTPILVLDDLDKVHGTKDQLLKLYGIVNGRKEARLPIIFTSKLPANELAASTLASAGSVGEDILDRLMQVAPEWKVLVSDHSYRAEALGF